MYACSQRETEGLLFFIMRRDHCEAILRMNHHHCTPFTVWVVGCWTYETRTADAHSRETTKIFSRTFSFFHSNRTYLNNKQLVYINHYFLVNAFVAENPIKETIVSLIRPITSTLLKDGSPSRQQPGYVTRCQKTSQKEAKANC